MSTLKSAHLLAKLRRFLEDDCSFKIKVRQQSYLKHTNGEFDTSRTSAVSCSASMIILHLILLMHLIRT